MCHTICVLISLFVDCCVFQDGRVPEQKIKLRHGDTLLIDTMEGNTMMNWLKRFLAGGFQVRPVNGAARFAAVCVHCWALSAHLAARLCVRLSANA